MHKSILDEVSISLDLTDALFVKFEELFLTIEYFFQEFLAALATTHLLARPHLLLESVQGARLFLTVGEDSLTFVEIAINELPFK